MLYLDIKNQYASTDEIVTALHEVANVANNLVDAFEAHSPESIPSGTIATHLFDVARAAADYSVIGGE